MSGPYYSNVVRSEREGGAWRLYLACGHSVYSAVAPCFVTGAVFCSYCYLEAGRRRQVAEAAELRELAKTLGVAYGD